MESAVGLRWAFSPKRQSAYSTAMANADMTLSHPFEGADFGQHTPNMSDNAALFGKGHEFATKMFLLSWDTRFRRATFLTTKLAGWAFAFHCGKVTTTSLDAGPPQAYQHVFEFQDPYGAGYYGSGRQLPVTTIVEQVSSGLVRKFPSMVVSAVELTGAGNDFTRISMDLIGSGVMVRLDASTHAASSATAVIGGGANGTVTATVTATGTGGNAYTIEVVEGSGTSTAMSAAIVSNAITVTLGTDSGGDLDPTKNTATLIAAAVGALTGIDAVASGTGASAITVAEGPHAFTGGAASTTQAITWPTGDAADEGERLRNTAMLFESGPTGLLANVSCDVRSWRFRSEYQLAEDDGYCPGSGYLTEGDPTSGQIRNKLEFLRRAVVLEFVVKASSSNTLFTDLEGMVELAVQITLNGGEINAVDDNIVIINVPKLKYRAVQIGADGDIITYSVSTAVMYDDTLANPYEVTINNEQASYLVAAT